MKRQTVVFIILFLSAASSFAQSKKQDSPLENFKVVNRHLIKGEEPGSIQLDAAPGDGIAWKLGSAFKEGTIEFDVKGKDVYQRMVPCHCQSTVSKNSCLLRGNAQPVLEVNSIASRKGSMIGFWVGNGSDGAFKNLMIKEKP